MGVGSLSHTMDPQHAGRKLLGDLPLTIADIPPERQAIQKLAAISGFVPINAHRDRYSLAVRFAFGITTCMPTSRE